MSKDLKVLMVPCSNSGVAYWRFWTFAQAAHRNRAMIVNVPWFQYAQSETNPWEVDITDPRHYARIMGEINEKVRIADVVIFQMVHTPAALNLFLTIKEAYPHLPVLAEIDDNILSTPEYNPANPYYAPGTDFRRLAVEQFKHADGLIVSTPYLKEVYSEMNDNIHVVQNAIDFQVWDKPQRRTKPGQVRIGWAGGASHAEDLRIIEPVVRRILAKHENARFVFVHGIPEFLKNIPRAECVSKFARIDKYPAFIAHRGFDIGLAPLVDNAFNRGKSNLRWLEYGAMRVPCVASDVGHFSETIRQGVDGVLCQTEDEWVEAISRLVTDKTARRKMGNQAYERIRQDFNTDKAVFDYERILRGVVERGPVKQIEAEEYGQPLQRVEQEISIPAVIQ